MSLKNILLVVSDMEQSKVFYHDLFGLQVIRDFSENVILTEGLVLQDKKIWEEKIGAKYSLGNACELFFEEKDWDAFLERAERYEICFVSDVTTNSWGKRSVMLKDPDGHLIEVAE